MGDFQAACHPHYYGMVATPSPGYPYGHMPTPQSLVVTPSEMSDTGAVSSSFPVLSPPATTTTTTPTAAPNLLDVAECFYNQPVTPHQPLPFTPGSIFSSDHLAAHNQHHQIGVSTPITGASAAIAHPQLARQLSSSSQVTTAAAARPLARQETPISPTQLPNDHRRSSSSSSTSSTAERSDPSSPPAFSPHASPKLKRRESTTATTTKLKQQRRQRQRKPSRRKSSATSITQPSAAAGGDLDEDEIYTNGNGGVGGTDRRQRVLERNRIAANRCRLRKRDEASALASREQEMEDQHRFLSDTLRSLATEVYELKSQLLQHTDCNCSLIQTYIAHEARKSVDSMMGVTSPPGSGSSSSAAGSAVESLGIRTPETEVGPGAHWAAHQQQHRASIAVPPPPPPATDPQQQQQGAPLVAAPPTTGPYHHEIPPLMLDPSSFATTPTSMPLCSAPYIATPDFISTDHNHHQQHIENSELWNPYWSFN